MKALTTLPGRCELQAVMSASALGRRLCGRSCGESLAEMTVELETGIAAFSDATAGAKLYAVPVAVAPASAAGQLWEDAV